MIIVYKYSLGTSSLNAIDLTLRISEISFSKHTFERWKLKTSSTYLLRMKKHISTKYFYTV